MKYEPVTIISAELPSLDFYTNTERTGMLRINLLDMGLSIVGVRINSLQGFLVVGSDYQNLRKLAEKYNQASIVFSDENRRTSKISSMDPEAVKNLGLLLNITKYGKLSLGEVNITFIEDGKQHVFSTEQ